MLKCLLVEVEGKEGKTLKTNKRLTCLFVEVEGKEGKALKTKG